MSQVRDEIYDGDDRPGPSGFDEDHLSYRVQQRFHVDRDGVVEDDFQVISRTGESKIFEWSTSLDPVTQRITPAARADEILRPPMMTKRARQSMHGLNVIRAA